MAACDEIKSNKSTHEYTVLPINTQYIKLNNRNLNTRALNHIRNINKMNNNQNKPHILYRNNMEFNRKFRILYNLWKNNSKKYINNSANVSNMGNKNDKIEETHIEGLFIAYHSHFRFMFPIAYYNYNRIINDKPKLLYINEITNSIKNDIKLKLNNNRKGFILIRGYFYLIALFVIDNPIFNNTTCNNATLIDNTNPNSKHLNNLEIAQRLVFLDEHGYFDLSLLWIDINKYNNNLPTFIGKSTISKSKKLRNYDVVDKDTYNKCTHYKSVIELMTMKYGKNKEIKL